MSYTQKETIEGPYYITTKKHQFELQIKKNEYFDYIHIGSKHFKFCIEISILKQNSIAIKGKLIQVKAEPECGFPTFLDRGDSISMIFATFQICKHFYPQVNIYEFEDDSHIECGVQQDVTMPPRKSIKPLSLAHLSIAIYGKTWYERHFNAKLLNPEKYIQFRTATENLDYPISRTFQDFPEFIRKYHLNSYIQSNLTEYFDTEKTWYEFFSSIPKKQHCDLFYNWLPSCISDILQDTYTNRGWYINTHTIPELHITVTNNPVYKGGRKKQTRRRTKRSTVYTFSNTRMGSIIL